MKCPISMKYAISAYYEDSGPNLSCCGGHGHC